MKRQAKVEDLMKQFARGVLIALAAILFITETVSAGILEFGLGARAVGMGQAQVAAVNDVSAMVYNPAAITYARQYWDLEPRDVFAQVQQITMDSNLYLNGIDQNEYYTPGMAFGAVLPITRRLTLSTIAYFPSDTTLVIEFFRGPTIHRYRPARWFYAVTGGSLQLTRKLSIGVGMPLTLHFNASDLNMDLTALLASVGLDLGPGTKDLNPAFRIDVMLSPSYELGMLYQPFKWMNIGAFYRYEQGNKFNVPIKIPPSAITEDKELVLLIDGYMFVVNPPQMSFGIALFPNKNLTIAFDMQYDMWSNIDPYLVIRSSNTDLMSGTEEPEERPEDVWWPKFGIEWKDRIGRKYSRLEYAVRGGYSFYKSPFPEMPEDSNYVDNDAHYFSGGISIGYHPRRLLEYVSLDYFYEYIHMVEREHKDIERSPSVIVSDGHVIYQGFGLTIKM